MLLYTAFQLFFPSDDVMFFGAFNLVISPLEFPESWMDDLVFPWGVPCLIVDK